MMYVIYYIHRELQRIKMVEENRQPPSVYICPCIQVYDVTENHLRLFVLKNIKIQSSADFSDHFYSTYT